MNQAFRTDLALDETLVRADLQRRLNSAPELRVNHIYERLLDAGIGCYIVGGAVRNWAQGLPARDLDIAITTPIQEAMKALEGVTAGVKTKVNESFGLTYVLGDVDSVDVTIMRNCDDIDGEIDDVTFKGGATLLQDALSRDFTINTFYYCLGTNTILNPFPSAKQDLEDRVARLIMDPRKTAVDYRIGIRLVQFLSRGYALSAESAEVLQAKLESDVLRFDDFGYWMDIYVPTTQPNYPAFKQLMYTHTTSAAAHARLGQWFEDMERDARPQASAA